MDLTTTTQNRLLSLDFFRGLTMFLLIGEWTGLFHIMVEHFEEGGLIHTLGMQFHHHPWNGLRFWDLVQPYFMFIVGVAIPFSVRNRIKKGQTSQQLLRHAIQRSLLLLVLGWALYCIDPGRITFRFQNVLAQLGVTYFVAFLLRNKSFTVQFLWSIGFLALNELLYRTFPLEGFNEAFVPDKNFGAYVDLLLSGELSGGHWVSFNAIPTTAHTIWGLMAGQLLLSDQSAQQKLRYILIAGLIGLIIGYALDPIVPIIKRISTSSFVFASGGWTFLTLGISYWIIDIKQYKSWIAPFVIIGLNPLFIYLFSHVGGANLVKGIVLPFTMATAGLLGEVSAQILTSLAVWFLLWYICYWLYKKEIFIRI